MSITVRSETTEDIPAIYEVNKLAFDQENESKLIDLLRESDAFIPALSLVAVIDDTVVGHILFTRITIVNDNKITESLALAPMAVLPQYQHQGIGKLLIENGLSRAKELNYKSVIVLGHPEYYPKFGFIPAATWNIKAPFDVPAEVFMAKELVEGGLNGISGLVHYPKEFSAVT